MEDGLTLVFSVLLRLAVIGGVLWLVYKLAMKALVFLRALTRPVRRVVRGALDPLERGAANHVAGALDEAGLHGAANATRGLPDKAASLEAAVGRHLDGHTSAKK